MDWYLVVKVKTMQNSCTEGTALRSPLAYLVVWNVNATAALSRLQ